VLKKWHDGLQDASPDAELYTTGTVGRYCRRRASNRHYRAANRMFFCIISNPMFFCIVRSPPIASDTDFGRPNEPSVKQPAARRSLLSLRRELLSESSTKAGQPAVRRVLCCLPRTAARALVKNAGHAH
jgi:hypothetical protein